MSKREEWNDGRAIAYEDEGQGTPVLLLHGFCGSSRYWRDVMPLLSASCRVIAPDLRGHGASSSTKGAYGMELLADDAAALLDRLNVQKAIVLGHSLGGYIALAFAERYPDRLLALGLVHSTSLPDGEAAKEGRLKTAERVKAEGVAPFVDGLVPKLFAPANRESMQDRVRVAIEIGYEASPDGVAGCALGMRERPDRTDVLRRSELPVLLLAGELDEIIPAERRFPASGGRIRQATLPGVGHMGMMEAPEPFAEAVLSYIREVPHV